MKSIFEIQLKDGASKSLDKIIGKVKEVTKQLNTFEKALGETIAKTTEKIVEQQKELEKLWLLTQKMASQKTKKQGGSKDSSASESIITDSKKKFEKFTSGVIRKISELKEKIKGIFESVRSYSAETIGKVKDKLKQGIETGIDKLKGLKEKTEGIVESIKKIGSEISQKVKGAANKAVDFAKEMYGKIKSQLGKKESKEGDSGKGKDLAEGPKSAKEAFLSLGNIGSQALMSIIGGSKELTEKFDGISGKLNGALKSALSNIQGEALKAFGPFIEDVLNLADQLLPYIIDVVNWVADEIGKFFKFLQDHQAIAYILGGAITAISLGVWLYNSAMGVASFVTGLCSGAMEILGLVIESGPLGWAVLVVGALAGAFMYLSSKVGGVGNAFHVIWETIKIVLTNIGNFFAQIFKPIFDTIDHIKKGEFLEAAKSAAEAAYNLSPIGLAVKTAQFVAGGGLTQGADKPYKDAAAKEDARKAQEEEDKKNNVSVPPEPAKKGTTAESGKIGANAPTSSGGGSGTNITIRIENLVKELIIQSVDGGIPVSDITKQISHALIAAVNDSQITVYNNG